MSQNILSQIYKAYQRYVPSPMAQSLILGGLTVPALYLTNKVTYDRLKRLAQDPRAAALAGLTPKQAQQSLAQFENSTFNKHGIPWLGGAAMFALSAVPHIDFNQPHWGLNKWYPAGDAAAKSFQEKEALTKAASLWGDQGYQPSFDFNTPLTQRTTVDLFANNPYIKDKSYERNLGTSIIMGAPSYGGQTTLGGVYDSAVNKFQKKLTLGGLAGSAMKGAVAGGLASLFTDTIGAVIGLPDPLRRSAANTAGFASAMCSILT